MPNGPGFWIAVYLAELMLVSLALGCLSLHMPRSFMAPRLTRFLTGFCLAPFLLALWVLLAVAAMPGYPRWCFLLPPSLIAAAILARYGLAPVRRIARWGRQVRQKPGARWPVFLAYACAGALVLSVMSKLAANGVVPVTGSDAGQYLGYSLRLAQGRSISSVTGYNDSPDGAMIGDMHGPVWHAFLSHALMTTGDNPLGYPHDHAVRVAFQATVVYMLLAVAALAAASGGAGVAPLSVILLLQVPQFEYISRACSRDAFRIIPLVLLAAVLAGLSPRILRRNFRFSALIPVAVLAAFSLAGHTLGGLVVPLIGLAWAAWVFAAGARWTKVVPVLLAMGAGLVVAGAQYIMIFLEVGRLPAAGYLHDKAIEGTPMQEAWNAWMKSRMLGTAGSLRKLSVLLARDQCRLSIFGLLCSLCAVLCWPKFTRRKKTSVILFTGCATLAVAIPFTGLADVGFKVSDWFIRNLRYALHWYPFAAVCAAMLSWHAYDRLVSGSGRRLRAMAGMVMAGIILAGAFSAHGTIVSRWRTNPGAEKRISAAVGPLKAVLRRLPSGERLLLDSDSLNYYLGNRAIVMYTRPAWDVTLAKNVIQAGNALKALNVGAVALQFAPHTGYWLNMPLLDLLSNSNEAMLMSEIPAYSMKVFTLNRSLPVRMLAETAFPITLPMAAVRCDELAAGKAPGYDWINRGYRGLVWVKKGEGEPETIQLIAGTPNEKGEHIFLLSPKAESKTGFPVVAECERVVFACDMRCAGAAHSGCGVVKLRVDAYSVRDGWRYYPMKVEVGESWRHFETAALSEPDTLGVCPTLIWDKPAANCVLEIRAPVLRWFSYETPDLSRILR